jgi:hypothetical protein
MDKLGTVSLGAGAERVLSPSDRTALLEHPALHNATQLMASRQIIGITRFMRPPW